jgi:hypothetical protein
MGSASQIPIFSKLNLGAVNSVVIYHAPASFKPKSR